MINCLTEIYLVSIALVLIKRLKQVYSEVCLHQTSFGSEACLHQTSFGPTFLFVIDRLMFSLYRLN